MTELKTTSIIMVGPTRVGKTSMLAAMYNELKQAAKRQTNSLAKYGLHMDAGPTQIKINDQQETLEDLADGEGLVVNKDDNLEGNSELRNYDFFIKIENDYKIPLRFTDLPGGWYTGGAGAQQAAELLENSHVSLLAVDAVALMEARGKYHSKINRTRFIEQVYDAASFKHEHEVILVLIRAETYVRNNQITELKRRAKNAYSELAGILKNKETILENGEIRRGVNISGCYIETVGSLFFNSYKENPDGSVDAIFMRDRTIGYKPSLCEIPLRMAAKKGMQHAVDDAVIEIEKSRGLWGWLIGTLGFETALTRARAKHGKLYAVLQDLSSQLNENDTFTISPRT
ncbi:MAG: hypothetical protein QM680_11140 [Luteolibacter sp.]